MINLIYTPQRADIKAKYIIDSDVLTVKIGEITEVFDFARLTEEQTERITVELLPTNPIIKVEKVEDIVNVTVIMFYGQNEKEIYEIQNG